MEDFKVSDEVIFIPPHAEGNHEHKDSERGVVSSMNKSFVFVRFYNRQGLLGHSQACAKKYLKRVS